MSAVVRKQHQDESRKDILVENTQLIFRNFAGRAGQYNQEGNRNVGILLDPETASNMASLGWPVKQLKSNPEYDDGSEPQDFIRVKVNFGGRPPRIVVVTNRGKTPLDESTVELLDTFDIRYVDVTINPYHYDFNGNRGITAYLRSIYVFIQEDYLDEKYEDIPYAADSPEQLAVETGDFIEADIVEDEDGNEVALLEIGQ